MNPSSTVTAPCPQPDCQAAVTLSEYAAATGQSVRTVREKVRRGQIPAELVKGRHGMEYRVYLHGDRNLDSTLTGTVPADYPQPDSHPTSTVTAPSQHPDGNLPELVALIERQQQTIMELSGRLGFYQARVQTLEGEVLALKAPASTSYGSAERENGPRIDVHAVAAARSVADPNDPSRESPQRPSERDSSPAPVETPNHTGDHVTAAQRPRWWARFWRWGVA